MLKALKECSNPKKYFDPVKFLEALQLDSLLPRKEVDTSLYVTNRAKLEQMYPYLFEGQIDAVPNVVYSTLKFTVSEEAEARAVKDKCKLSPQLTHQPLHVYAFHSETSIVSCYHHMLVSQLHMCVHCLAHSSTYCVYVCIAQLMNLCIPLIFIQLQSTCELDGMP